MSKNEWESASSVCSLEQNMFCGWETSKLHWKMAQKNPKWHFWNYYKCFVPADIQNHCHTQFIQFGRQFICVIILHFCRKNLPVCKRFQTSSLLQIFSVKHQIGKFSILNLVILFSYWQKNSIYLLYNTELNFSVLAGWAGTAKKICKKRARIKKMTRAPTKRRIFVHPAHFSHFKE